VDNKKLDYFRDRLLKEKEKVAEIINGLDHGGLDDSLRDSTSELSSYDNHPADIGTETFEIERNRGLRANEVTQLKMIERALEKIDKGGYGTCEICGREIDGERLEALPSASLCIDCKETRVPDSLTYWQDRPIEETVIGYPFGSTNKDNEDYTGYDGEDVWQELESFNSINYMLWDDEDESMQGIVEETDKISNEQYKRQLPD
jgi:sporulation protein, yteA family